MATTGHESEAINVQGLKASLKKGGNKGIYNEAICSTAGGTAAKVTNTVPPSFSLVSGAKIVVKFTYAIAVANATLQVGSTAAKPIYFRGAALPSGAVKAGTSLLLSYDGTSYNIIGGLGEQLDEGDGIDITNGVISVDNSIARVSEVNSKVATAKSELLGDAATDYNTLGKLEDKIQAEATARENADTALDGRVDDLETAVGTGGSVDSRIAAAKTEIIGNATSACDTLGEAEALINDRYTKSETYTKTEVNGLVDTPHQNYVTVATYASLPASGSKDTIYRVSNYNGSTSQVDTSVYSEYAWNGSQYIFLCVKSQIGEVFDISVYNNNAKYADLAAALNGGANIPQSLQKGGMSVKFVRTSDNKYVQYFLTKNTWSANKSYWEKMNLEEEVIETAVVNLTQDSPYYVSTLKGAYLASGTITSNQYTTGYRISLFRLPAGKYNLKTTTSATAGEGVIFGLLSSESDLVVGGTLSEILITGDGTEQDETIVFNEESLLVILWAGVDFNCYGSLDELKEEHIKSKVQDLEDGLNEVNKNISELDEQINGDIDFIGSFSMVGNGTNYHQENVSTLDVSNYAGKEITVSLGSVSSSASTTNSCIVGYVQTAGGENLNNTGRIKAGNSATILLPSNAGKILIQAFPAFNGGGIPDVDGATYTFSDISITTLFCIEKRLEALESEQDFDLQIQIPDTIFTVVGTELNIWNDTVSYSIDRGLVSPLNYAISWQSNVGQITERGYHFTPVDANAGNTYTLKCIVYSLNGNIIAEKNISIVVKAKNALTSAKNIIFFGDSTGASSANALYNALHDNDRFTGTIPTMLGSRGTSTIRYEAFGGAQWSDYATAGRAAFRCFVTNAPTIPLNARYTNNGFTWQVVEVNITDGVGNILITKDSLTYTDTPEASGTLVAVESGVQDIAYTSYENAPANPLWDSTLNNGNGGLSISHYKDVLGISQSTKIDAVFFQLGLNHGDLGTNLENLITYITSLYNLFVNDNANCIVILGLTTTAGNTQDGSGVNYGASIPPITHNIRMYNIRKAYMELFAGGTLPNLRLAPTDNNVDRFYGYDFSQREVAYTVNYVKQTKTELYHNNMVHPGSIGYRQMGDTYFASFIGNLV